MTDLVQVKFEIFGKVRLGRTLLTAWGTVILLAESRAGSVHLGTATHACTLLERYRCSA